MLTRPAPPRAQVMLNEIIMRGGHQPITPLDADPAVVPGFQNKVGVHFLPALQFASGYVHFMQRLPQRCVAFSALKH